MKIQNLKIKYYYMKVKEILRILTDEGWVIVRQKGSHRQLKHPTKEGTVTVAGKLSDDIAKGTEASTRRQAGLN